MSQTSRRVAAPPERPVLVYDGDCNFCALWVRRWHRSSNESFDCVPFQDPQLAVRFPELSLEAFSRAVHFIGTDGSVHAGAEAVYRAVACHQHGGWLLDWHLESPVFARSSEAAYRFVARHRFFFSFLTRLLWGRQPQPSSHLLVRWLFLRLLGLVYLAAFLSLWSQITGLIGAQGILPAEQTMEAARSEMILRHEGLKRYQLMPTLCWISATDRSLRLQCAAGTVLAVLLVADFAAAPCLFLLWLIYLSLTVVGREFLGFQWDNLLLETGLFAIFVAPLHLLPRRPKAASCPPRFGMWLLRWLLFQLMFESGCVKLLSGDRSWRDLAALDFHYETQPLPTWIGWYAGHLSHSAQKACTVAMFIIELALPFLIFLPRRPRQLACAGFVLLQVCILLTGNYCFFNYLTIALCLLLLDDAALERLLAFFGLKTLLRKFVPSAQPPRPTRDDAVDARGPGISPRGFWRSALNFFGLIVTAVAVLVSLLHLASNFHIRGPWPRPLLAIYAAVAPLRTFNGYGLFAVMTTSRSEIVVEGSQDGMHWQAYEFKYKPGALNRRPGFIAPHQPRLDWQMWFAALGDYRQNQWFVAFCGRLLQGSAPVLGLLKPTPFPESPPRYVRAILYDYHFTNLATKNKTGDWWQRQPLGLYLPAISLSPDSHD